ncbi:hydrogen gas-evolving membrane-bound hydrogenase subunit E [Deinococcus hohokamensis]|uniref:Hydrogen gas-evolving membrane-bound hydrogenase subunit E n=1 Tax=Deinococcus hohokamensis TaxID=309883 RepID=A0ABV9I9C0_9DEIO
MSLRLRTWLFTGAVLVMAALFLWGLSGVPAFGHYRGPYGDILNQVTVPERHVTNVVAAVTFDVRGFDTLGEEFILFASVIGVTVLLRQLRDEDKERVPDARPGQHVPPTSDAIRALTLILTGPLSLFSLYVIAHGHVSPGGGFQGGVMLATALLLVYLAGDLEVFGRVTPHALLEAMEAIGLTAFVLFGIAGLLFGSGFLENVLPLGKAKDLLSGGFIPLLNVATGLAVSAGLLLLLKTFLEQALELREEPEA